MCTALSLVPRIMPDGQWIFVETLKYTHFPMGNAQTFVQELPWTTLKVDHKAQVTERPLLPASLLTFLPSIVPSPSPYLHLPRRRSKGNYVHLFFPDELQNHLGTISKRFHRDFDWITLNIKVILKRHSFITSSLLIHNHDMSVYFLVFFYNS